RLAGREAQELRQEVEKARQALQAARNQAALPALQEEKASLARTLATSMPSRAEESKITLKLWEWAAESGVQLRDLEHDIDTIKLGGEEFIALKYQLLAVGEPQALHRFMGLVDTSQYAPQAEELSLTPAQGGRGEWDLSVNLIVPARKG
ncbi:MAG: hypothetical protein AAB270_02780, partial [Chloroflexota bacterium]